VAGTAAKELRRTGIKLSALAQDGLILAANDYDVDRYQQAGWLAVELLAELSGRPAEGLAIEPGRDSGYATGRWHTTVIRPCQPSSTKHPSGRFRTSQWSCMNPVELHERGIHIIR
jgi:hypothetical protein